MPDIEKKFRSLKREAEKLKSEVGRAEGRLAKLKDDLKKQFGTRSIKKARGMLATLESEAAAKETEFREALAEFEKEWSDD